MSDVRLIVRVDDDEVRAGLRKTARTIQKDADATVGDYTRRSVVPTARSLAPRIIAGTLVARTTEQDGTVLTTTARGVRLRIVGITNFGGPGGKVDYPIRPRRKKALRLRDGRVVAVVTGPRAARPMSYLEKSVEKRRVGLERHTQEALTAVIQRRVVGIEGRR